MQPGREHPASWPRSSPTCSPDSGTAGRHRHPHPERRRVFLHREAPRASPPPGLLLGLGHHPGPLVLASQGSRTQPRRKRSLIRWSRLSPGAGGRPWPQERITRSSTSLSAPKTAWGEKPSTTASICGVSPSRRAHSSVLGSTSVQRIRSPPPGPSQARLKVASATGNWRWISRARRRSSGHATRAHEGFRAFQLPIVETTICFKFFRSR